LKKKAILLFLMIITVLLIGNSIIKLPYKISRGYNEGWNAYQSLHAFDRDLLYPEFSQLTANNYPPLSYFVNHMLAKLTGDYVIAARVTAIFSLIIVTVLIIKAGILLDVSRDWALFGGFMFISFIAARCESYVAVNDPQWLAHAFQMIGLILFLKSNRRDYLFYLSNFLLVTSGFVKHILLPLPIALTLWLLFIDRKAFFVWIAISLLTISAAFIFFTYLFGTNFIENLFNLGRIFTVERVIGKCGVWLVPLTGFLFVAALSIFIFRKCAISDPIRLLQMYFILSLLWA